MESYKIVDNAITQLPSHEQIHEDLIVFRDLLAWINRSGCFIREQRENKSYYEDIKNEYINASKHIYAREFIAFCTGAKIGVFKCDNRNKNGKFLFL